MKSYPGQCSSREEICYVFNVYYGTKKVVGIFPLKLPKYCERSMATKRLVNDNNIGRILNTEVDISSIWTYKKHFKKTITSIYYYTKK